MYAERGAIDDLSFQRPPDDYVDIASVLYALTGKIHKWNLFWGFSGKGYANLLKKNLDQIETFFGEDYAKNKEALKSAQKEYHEAIT